MTKDEYIKKLEKWNKELGEQNKQLLEALEASQKFIRSYFAIIEYEELNIAKSLGFDELIEKTDQALAAAKPVPEDTTGGGE